MYALHASQYSPPHRAHLHRRSLGASAQAQAAHGRAAAPASSARARAAAAKGGSGKRWRVERARCCDETSTSPQTAQHVGSWQCLAPHCGQA